MPHTRRVGDHHLDKNSMDIKYYANIMRPATLSNNNHSAFQVSSYVISTSSWHLQHIDLLSR